MDHYQRGCARCGKPAGDLGFCEPCRAHIEALTWQPIRATMPAPDLSGAAARAQRAVMRLEQALAAVTNANANHTLGDEPSGAVQTDEGPRGDSGSDDAGTTPLELVRFSGSAEERVTEVEQPPRDVARFEDVMKVAPRPVRAVAELAPAVPKRDSIAPPEATPVTPREDAAPATPQSIAPPEETVSTEPDVELAPAAEPGPPAPFWFELVPVVEPAATEPQAEAPQVEPEPVVVEPVASKPPPVAVSAVPEQPRVEAQPHDAHQRNWVAALFLLALIALVVLLTGREPRRSN
jgi:hypothetical protein